MESDITTVTTQLASYLRGEGEPPMGAPSAEAKVSNAASRVFGVEEGTIISQLGFEHFNRLLERVRHEEFPAELAYQIATIRAAASLLAPGEASATQQADLEQICLEDLMALGEKLGENRENVDVHFKLNRSNLDAYFVCFQS